MTYELIRSRRRTVSIQVKADGSVVVRAPLRCSRMEIDRFVQSKAAWIQQHKEAAAKRAALQKETSPPPLTDEQLRHLHDLARIVFPERTEYYADRMGVTYGRITIRHQRTRWGSCSARGNLNFNCLLLLAPPQVLDYVVVHELCHRLELNHSARFWAQVEKAMPDFRIHRKWLKDNGRQLMQLIR